MEVQSCDDAACNENNGEDAGLFCLGMNVRQNGLWKARVLRETLGESGE